MTKEKNNRDAIAANDERPERAKNNGKPSPEPEPEQSAAGQAEEREQRITRIGAFELANQIGEGASGIVYQAEQQEPVLLKAALKLIKHGLNWRQVVARFEAVKHLLSLLDHPNIAKLLGSGTRPSGQPYFVMELVEGPPLTKYCDEHQLSLQQRLEMFVAVCQAVQHAHQKGVIHGDLKPSNVLASSQDGKPAPKVLDFGVAEAVRRKPSDKDRSADPEALDGKPEYLSPEQADADARDIDTRSDVYSLGVLLYELVTGTTPLTPERLSDVSRTETLRLVREEEAPEPSKRLQDSKERLERVAAKRQMKPDALVKAVSGDLDCVVRKALQKDRTGRYDTVSELARDIQRYLAKEPVEACPHGTRAQLRTLARQHSRVAMFAALVLLFCFVVAGASAGLAAWQWHKAKQAEQAEQEAVEKQKKVEKSEKESEIKYKQTKQAYDLVKKERDRAREGVGKARAKEEEAKAILAFVKNKLLSAGRPGDVSLEDAFWAGSQGNDVTVRKNVSLRTAVDEADSRIAPAFGDRPLAEATIREMLGYAYMSLGDAKQAVKQYERAFELRKIVRGDKHPETADARNQLAVAYRLAGRDLDASRLFHHNPDSPTHAAALADHGAMLILQKKPAEAERNLRESLTIRSKIQPDEWTTFETKSLLGEALLDQKKYADAEPLLRSGYEGMKQRESHIPSSKKARLTQALERLVRLYDEWGKKDKAAPWRKELEKAKSVNKP